MNMTSSNAAAADYSDDAVNGAASFSNIFTGAFGGLLFLVGLLALITIAVSTVALGLMMKFATGLVKFSLIFSVAMGAVIAVFGLMNGQLMMGLMGLGMAAIGACYAKMVWYV